MKLTILKKPKEVAVILGTTEKSLSGMRQNGTGPKFIKLGNSRKSSIRYREDDLQEYINSFERR
jgi:hypothetical protein